MEQAIDRLRANDPTLVKLDLYYKELNSDGAKAIANALKTNTFLTELKLGWNDIRNDGAEAIAEALKINTTLTKLDLHSNLIENNGAKALAEALKVNNSLTSVDLKYNPFDERTRLFIDAIVRHNGMLTSFEPGNADVNCALERNRRAHEKARNAVIHLLTIGEHRLELETTDDALTAALRILPRDIYVVLARRLWATRGDSSWWEEEVDRPAKTNKLKSNCIQCSINPARFMEETQPNYRFCSELCQWILRVGSRHGISLEGVFE